jgi:hypothetical protein
MAIIARRAAVLLLVGLLSSTAAAELSPFGERNVQDLERSYAGTLHLTRCSTATIVDAGQLRVGAPQLLSQLYS